MTAAFEASRPEPDRGRVMASNTELIGAIESFDLDRGLGVVIDEAGTRYPLHCTQIADGSRSIAVGARVTFEILAKLGRHEATNVRPR